MRSTILTVSLALVVLVLPGSARAGWLFHRTSAPADPGPPPSRWVLASPASLPAPADYLDGPTAPPSPPIYLSPYHYGPQTGYAFPYYHSYPASYDGPRPQTDGIHPPVYRVPGPIQPSPGSVAPDPWFLYNYLKSW